MLNLKRMLTKLANRTVIVRKSFVGTQTLCPAGENINLRVDVTTNGYKAIGIAGIGVQNGYANIISFGVSDTEASIWIRNMSTATIIITPTVYVFFQKIQ